MNEYEVHTRNELIAAVRAAALPTFEEAKRNPVRITFGTCVYTFKEGIHVGRAEAIVKNARRLLRRNNAGG